MNDRGTESVTLSPKLRFYENLQKDALGCNLERTYNDKMQAQHLRDVAKKYSQMCKKKR